MLDPDVRRIDGGAVLVGGVPLRILRLTDAGTKLIDRLVAGEAVPRSFGAQRLVRRLLDAGIAHPRPGRSTRDRAHVTIVIPVKGGPGKLAGTLDALGKDFAAVVVVDDGSTGDAVGQVARARRNGSPARPHARSSVGAQHRMAKCGAD